LKGTGLNGGKSNAIFAPSDEREARSSLRSSARTSHGHHALLAGSPFCRVMPLIYSEGGKDSGKKHTDRRIKPRLVIMKALGVVPMAPAFGWD
jgi:hypothetical protein